MRTLLLLSLTLFVFPSYSHQYGISDQIKKEEEVKEPVREMKKNDSEYRGGESNKVRAVEQQLLNRGYRVNADGIMDKATTDALRRFQERNNLEAVGEINEETLRALNIHQPQKETQ